MSADNKITIKSSRGKTALSVKRAIAEICNEVVEDANNAMTQALDDTATWTAGELRKESMKHGWKHYYKGWTYKRTGKKGNTFEVYNESHGQLTHLLEKGHRIITPDGRDTGKRSKAIPHIAPVNEQVPDKVDEFFNERAKELGL